MFDIFVNRSGKKEVLDFPGMDLQLLEKNFSEMDLVNQWTGAFSSICKELKTLLKDNNKKYTLIDIGCGSGEMLSRISKWAIRNNYKISLAGADINPDAIKIAKKKNPSIEFFNESFDETLQKKDFDIIISSLFCHHLSDTEFVEFLKLCRKKAREGFLISDLQRHPIPYYSIFFLSKLVRTTTAFKNDAPLSVLRGFIFPEIAKALKQAEVENYRIRNNWAFRFLISSNNI